MKNWALVHLAFGTLSAAVLALPVTATAQQADFDAEAFRRAQEEFNKVPNTAGDGPYPAMVEADPGLPGHVIYRPRDLSPFADGTLPVLAWGNGGCADDGTAHRLHLAQIASYGYLVVAAGEWRSGPGATAPREQARRSIEDGRLPPPATTTEEVRAGLDWALTENRRAGSRYHGKLAENALGVAGHSCGGLQAIQIAADPRIKTVLVHNSGIYNDGVQAISNLTVTKDMLEGFHTPVIYILGGPSDIAYPNGTDDFSRVNHVPIALANLPVGHGGTFSQPMGGAVAHVSVDWLEWQLKGDPVAARTFVGANCRLCSGSNWTIERKGM